jgi:IS30 family transposase
MLFVFEKGWPGPWRLYTILAGNRQGRKARQARIYNLYNILWLCSGRLKQRFATLKRKSDAYVIISNVIAKTVNTMTLESAKAFRHIPKVMRKTLTVDNGKEFSHFKELEEKTGFCIYFVDPYSAWQRGCNENTNGLLRQYFPKGMNFSNMTNEDLALAVKKLNRRPRKCLYYQTPHEVFYSAIRGALAC